MADIAMCRSVECPARHECYRQLAPVNPYRQSYADFDAVRDAGKACEEFVPAGVCA